MRLTRKGRGMVAAVQCAALIAPYRLPAEGGDGYRGRLRCANRPYAKVATAPDCRCHIAPLTIDHEKGANRRRWISYGFIERLTMAAVTQLSETVGFFALAQTFIN